MTSEKPRIEDDREKIFAAIRRGLRNSEQVVGKRSNASPLMSESPADFDSLFKKFDTELRKLGGEAVVMDDDEATARFLETKLKTDSSVFIYEDARLGRKTTEVVKSRTSRVSSEFRNGYDKRDVSGFDSAISSCVACVAETGTVVIDNKMRLPAALATSLFVIADRKQLLASLDELFTPQYRDFGGSNLFLITGPSRTADIEKELVTGVHGPKEVCVIFSKQYR